MMVRDQPTGGSRSSPGSRHGKSRNGAKNDLVPPSNGAVSAHHHSADQLPRAPPHPYYGYSSSGYPESYSHPPSGNLSPDQHHSANGHASRPPYGPYGGPYYPPPPPGYYSSKSGLIARSTSWSRKSEEPPKSSDSSNAKTKPENGPGSPIKSTSSASAPSSPPGRGELKTISSATKGKKGHSFLPVQHRPYTHGTPPAPHVHPTPHYGHSMDGYREPPPPPYWSSHPPPPAYHPPPHPYPGAPPHPHHGPPPPDSRAPPYWGPPPSTPPGTREARIPPPTPPISTMSKVRPQPVGSAVKPDGSSPSSNRPLGSSGRFRKKKDNSNRAGATSPSQIESTHRDEVQHMGCTCKKTRCLKLYCQCFGAKLYCGRNCRCLACHNNTEHAKERKEAMRSIMSRNPGAFDTKFKKSLTVPAPATAAAAAAASTSTSASTAATGSPASVTVAPAPASPSDRNVPVAPRVLAHKVGCKCRKSACMKKYCECYASNVRCHASCRCMGCKNRSGMVSFERGGKPPKQSLAAGRDGPPPPAPHPAPETSDGSPPLPPPPPPPLHHHLHAPPPPPPPPPPPSYHAPPPHPYPSHHHHHAPPYPPSHSFHHHASPYPPPHHYHHTAPPQPPTEGPLSRVVAPASERIVPESPPRTLPDEHAASPGAESDTNTPKANATKTDGAEPWVAAQNLTFLKRGSPASLDDGTSGKKRKLAPVATTDSGDAGSMPSLASSVSSSSPAEEGVGMAVSGARGTEVDDGEPGKDAANVANRRVDAGVNSLLMAAYAMTEFTGNAGKDEGADEDSLPTIATENSPASLHPDSYHETGNMALMPIHRRHSEDSGCNAIQTAAI